MSDKSKMGRVRGRFIREAMMNCYYCGILTVEYIDDSNYIDRAGRFYIDDVNDLYCDDRVLTVDHLIPVCVGGETVKDNLVPSCNRCNILKDDNTIDRFIAEYPNITDNIACRIKNARTGIDNIVKNRIRVRIQGKWKYVRQ